MSHNQTPSEYDFDRKDDSLEDRHVGIVDFDPSKINYITFDPNTIDTLDQGLPHIKHLRSIDRTQMEEIAYQAIMNRFGLVEEDPSDITPEQKKLIASDFELYVRYAFKNEFGMSFEMSWHHTYMCNLFQRLYLGTNECPRVIINIPPRYSKTQMLLYWVSWTLGHVPDSEYIMVGYSKMISENGSAQIREVMESDWYQALFNTRLSKKSKAKDKFETVRRGRVFATSVGGTVTGFGAGRKRNRFGGAIIVDDGNKASDANSQVERDKTNEWYAGTLLSRRNNMELTPIINIQQRVHENDITGYVLPSKEKPKGETGELYQHVLIPAIMSLEQLDNFGVPKDSTSRTMGDTERDEYPLWHEKISLEKLRNMKESLASIVFYGQYQQVPFVDGGDILRSEWLEEVETPHHMKKKYVVQTIDTAQTVKTRSDWSVIMTGWKLVCGRVYIHDIRREKVKAPGLVAMTQQEFVKHKPRRMYIEFKSSGIGLVQTLKVGKIPMPIEIVKRDGGAGDSDKETRASGAATYLSNGWIVVKKGAPWLSDLYQEMDSFPNGKWDDIVDCLVEMCQQEIMPDGRYMADMDSSVIPAGEQTYGELENTEDIVPFEEALAAMCGGEAIDPDESYSSYSNQESDVLPWMAQLTK